jgi:hypothetical protein
MKMKIIETLDALIASDAPCKNSGEGRVARAYALAREKNADAILVNEVVWEREYEDFDAALREYGIDTVFVTDKSTALMDTLRMLLNHGFAVTGTTEVLWYPESVFGSARDLRLAIILERAESAQ